MIKSLQQANDNRKMPNKALLAHNQILFTYSEAKTIIPTKNIAHSSCAEPKYSVMSSSNYDQQRPQATFPEMVIANKPG